MSWRHFQDVFKTSWRRLAKTSSRSFEEIFKTSSRHLQDVLQKRVQDVLKTSTRRIQDIFKTSSKCLQEVLQKRLQEIFKTSSRYFFKIFLQDIFKAYHQVKLFLVTKTVIYRGICLGNTNSEKLWSMYKICKRDKNFSRFSFSLYYTFSWLLTEAYLEPRRTSTIAFFCGNT